MMQRLIGTCLPVVVVLLSLNGVYPLQTCDDLDVDLVIIGGGMSGIAAATEIERSSNLTYLVLEGQSCLGGRLQSQRFNNDTHIIELGANWIVGSKRNPIWKLAQDVSLSTAVQNWNSIVVYHEGQKVKKRDMNWDTFEMAAKCLDDNAISRTLGLINDNDVSARAMLESCGWTPTSYLDDLIEYMTIDYEHAISPERISVDGGFPEYAREHFDQKDRLVIDKRGFASIVQAMALGLSHKPMLNTDVVLIDYSGEGVKIQTESLDQEGYSTPCHVISARKVISTLSVGVLNKRRSIFYPPFPNEKLNDMNSVYEMALFHKAFFAFPEKFWGNKEIISFAMEEKGKCQVWQNLDTTKFLHGSHILFCTVTDMWASRFEELELNDDEIQREVLKSLKSIYPDMPDPIDFAYSRWATNRWTFGSYEARIVNGTTSEFEHFIAPIKDISGSNTIYISGSASCKYHYGYVHGAYWAGLRSAKQVLKDFGIDIMDDHSSCDEESVTFHGEQFIV